MHFFPYVFLGIPCYAGIRLWFAVACSVQDLFLLLPSYCDDPLKTGYLDKDAVSFQENFRCCKQYWNNQD